MAVEMATETCDDVRSTMILDYRVASDENGPERDWITFQMSKRGRDAGECSENVCQKRFVGGARESIVRCRVQSGWLIGPIGSHTSRREWLGIADLGCH